MAASNGIPDDVLKQLISDPEFQKMDESGQDRLLSRFAQDTYGNVPATENILQRAAKVVTSISPQQVGYEMMGGTAPSDIGMGLGMAATGQPFSSGLNPMAQAEGMREGAVGDNPLLGIATDPMTYAGMGGVGKGAVGLGKSLMKPSKAYGQALSKAPGKVDFLKIISKHEGDPIVQKVLKKANIFKKYGGSNLEEGGAMSEKLANLSAKESQNLINDVKLGKDALVQGKRIRPNEIGLAEFFSDLSKVQSKLPGVGGAKKMYGVAKNVGKFVKSNVGKLATGSVIGAGAKLGYDALK